MLATTLEVYYSIGGMLETTLEVNYSIGWMLVTIYFIFFLFSAIFKKNFISYRYLFLR